MKNQSNLEILRSELLIRLITYSLNSIDAIKFAAIVSLIIYAVMTWGHKLVSYGEEAAAEHNWSESASLPAETREALQAEVHRLKVNEYKKDIEKMGPLSLAKLEKMLEEDLSKAE